MHYIVEENIFAIVVWKILEQTSLTGQVKDYFKMDGKIMIKMAKKMWICKIQKLWKKNKITSLKILSRANSLIVNKNIRSVILEIKNGRCKIVKILIFLSLL